MTQKIIAGEVKEIPILFSTPMVQAILDGRKTMTRRIVKPQPSLITSHRLEKDGSIIETRQYSPDRGGGTYDVKVGHMHSKYGKPGDVLWVRERFWIQDDKAGSVLWFADTMDARPYDVYDDWCINEYGFDKKDWPKWKPSIHMPKSACRIWLEVVSVKVERLQEISQEDAKAEGITPIGHRPASEGCKPHADNSLIRDCYVCAFKVLWNLINGKSGNTWNANPWVWVVEFKRINTPS